MASIHNETILQVPPTTVWAALSAVDKAHVAFAGVLSDCRFEREDVRVVTFVDGRAVKEQIISIEPARMRIAYTVIESPLVHHSASMQVTDAGNGTSRFLWTTDVLPHDAAEWIRPLMDAGARALQTNIESSPANARA